MNIQEYMRTYVRTSHIIVQYGVRSCDTYGSIEYYI